MPTFKELIERRKALYEKMSDNSLLVLYAGALILKSNDLFYEFEVNKNFYYLTGITEDNAVFLAYKHDGRVIEELFIRGFDERLYKFTGRLLTFEEASNISGVEDVFSVTTLDFEIDSFIKGRKENTPAAKTVYLDVNDAFMIGLNKTTENMKQALELNYGIEVKSITDEIVKLRLIKSRNEILHIKEAVKKADQGFKNVLKHLKVGAKEIQLERDLMYFVKDLGRDSLYRRPFVGVGRHTLSFVNKDLSTIAKDGELLVIDAAVKEEKYVASVARTYPVNGKFSNEQAKVYKLLLESIDNILEEIKPGANVHQLNQKLHKNLAESALNLKILRDSDILNRAIPHILIEQIGLEEKESFLVGGNLEAGSVITVAPSIFLEDRGYSVRLKDIVVVTQEGSYLLSKSVLREINEIETALASRD